MAVFLGGFRVDAPPVKLDDVAFLPLRPALTDRDHEAAPQVFAAVFPVDARRLQMLADLRTLVAVFVRDAKSQRAVGKADFEPLPQLGIIEAAAGKIPAGGLVQRF